MKAIKVIIGLALTAYLLADQFILLWAAMHNESEDEEMQELYDDVMRQALGKICATAALIVVCGC